MKLINNKEWKNKGIIKIKDLLLKEKIFMNTEDLQSITNLTCNFLQLFHIRNAIPNTWREILLEDDYKLTKHNIGDVYTKEGEQLNISTFTSKNAYLICINRKWEKPKGVTRWGNTLDEFKTVEWQLWEKLYKLPCICCRNIKLQIIQYKILNYIINCNEKLNYWKLMENNICELRRKK